MAILPSSAKKTHAQALADFPVLPILEHIFKTPALKLRFAPIVAGWMDNFSNEQLASMTSVLLSFMEQEGQNQSGEVLVGCCQCLNKLVTRRQQAIDLQEVVHRAVPVLLAALGTIDNPDVLWPIVTLVAGVVAKGQLQSEVIVKALEGDRLGQLVTCESGLLV